MTIKNFCLVTARVPIPFQLSTLPLPSLIWQEYLLTPAVRASSGVDWGFTSLYPKHHYMTVTSYATAQLQGRNWRVCPGFISFSTSQLKACGTVC